MVPASVILTLVLVSSVGAVRHSDDEDLASAGIIHGESSTYTLGRKLGSGAYGVVYLATDDSTGEQVVAKTIDLSTPEAQISFATERNVWMYMQSCPGYPHPNVIRYNEVLQQNAREGVVVMELASGGSLSSLLYSGVSAEGALRGVRTAVGDEMITDEALAKRVFGQLAAGAQWLAQCGVIHKDLKPDNIMLSKPLAEGGVLKIIDMGLAAVLTSEDSGPDANMYYNLAQSVNIRTNPLQAETFDDFALGMILAEIGTGVPPFFNPKFDYFSEKGNLQDEKGLLYILATKSACAKGDKGLWYPKKDLANGKVDMKESVKEVVGRSLYFIEKKTHFMYRSAAEQSIGNKQDLAKSWLYNSESAMSLLKSLMAWDTSARISPKTLMSAAWLADSGAGEAQPEEISTMWPSQRKTTAGGKYSARPSPKTRATDHDDFAWPSAKKPRVTGGDEFQWPREKKTKATDSDEFAWPSAKTNKVNENMAWSSQKVQNNQDGQDDEGETHSPVCKNVYKESGPPSVCKLRFTGSSNCYAKVSCGGKPSQWFELQPGFGGGEVDKCPSCKVVN